MDEWQNKPIVVLEADEPEGYGDLTIFANKLEAEQLLEAIDVRTGGYFGYTIDGQRVKFETYSGAVLITLDSAQQCSYEAVVRRLLERAAFYQRVDRQL